MGLTERAFGDGQPEERTVRIVRESWEKEAIVLRVFEQTPEISDRRIAELAGLAPNTVASLREKSKQHGRAQIAHVHAAHDYREDTMGRKQPTIETRERNYTLVREAFLAEPEASAVSIGAALQLDADLVRRLRRKLEEEGILAARTGPRPGGARVSTEALEQVRMVLRGNPQLANSTVAGMVGIDSRHVSAQRRALEVEGKIQKSDPRRRERDPARVESVPSIPLGDGYSLVWADPPWMPAIESEEGQIVARRAPVQTKKLIELTLQNRPLGDLLSPNAALLLWCPPALFPDALAVIDGWGFRYVTHLVWQMTGARDRPGMWTIRTHDDLLLAVRGKPPRPDRPLRPLSVSSSKIPSHGDRPVTFFKMAERMFPRAKRLLLFPGAIRRIGWDCAEESIRQVQVA